MARTPLNTYVDEKLGNRARDIAVHDGCSLTAVLEKAILEFVERRELERGRPFPRNRRMLKPGPKAAAG